MLRLFHKKWQISRPGAYSSAGDRVEPAGLEFLYRTHAEEIWRFFRSRCRNDDEALDLLQTLFLKLVPVANRGEIRSREARGLLYHSARNLLKDRRRSQQKTDPLSHDPPGRPPTDDEAIHRAVDEFLNSRALGERQRAAMEFRLFGRLPLESIATMLGVSLRTVHRDLDAGMEKLRRALRARGITPEDMQ